MKAQRGSQLADLHTKSVDASEYAAWIRSIVATIVESTDEGQTWRTDAELLDRPRVAAALAPPPSPSDEAC